MGRQILGNYCPHSWFTNVVDGTELGQVYPIQLKPLKYEDHEDEAATGANRFYGSFWYKYSYPNYKFRVARAQLIATGVSG